MNEKPEKTCPRGPVFCVFINFNLPGATLEMGILIKGFSENLTNVRTEEFSERRTVAKSAISNKQMFQLLIFCLGT